MLPWQRNLGQNRLQHGLYKRYPRDLCVQQVFFWVGLLNDARQILPQPTPVAMATKIWDEIGYNSACIRDIREIFVYISFFWGVLLNDARQILP